MYYWNIIESCETKSVDRLYQVYQHNHLNYKMKKLVFIAVQLIFKITKQCQWLQKYVWEIRQGLKEGGEEDTVNNSNQDIWSTFFGL